MPSDLLDWTKKESTEVFKTEIEIEYVHQLKELYKTLHVWFEEKGYGDFNGGENFETLYWQRDLPNGLAEHHMWWRCQKHPGTDKEKTEFFTFFIKFDYQTIAVDKAEVMHKGKKWKLFQSDTIMRIEAHLIQNYDKQWNEGLLKGMKTKWKLWLYKDRIKQYETELYNETLELVNTLKGFVQLRQEKKVPTGINPANALP